MKEHALRIGERAVTLLEGPAGWGELSPLPGYPCDPGAARRAAEEAAGAGFPPALRSIVRVNALVPDGAVVDDALARRLAGFACVKVKVGRRDPADDVQRLRDLRARLGSSVAIRVDANGAWDVETATATLGKIERAGVGLELAEQPVATISELAEVRRVVTVPVAADECVLGIDDALELRRADAADVLVLKVQPAGGVRAALAIAEAAALPVVVSSMLETSIGLAAGLALAAALPDLPYACGLATLDEIGGDVVAEPLRPRDGALAVPAVRPVPDPALLARYAVGSAS